MHPPESAAWQVTATPFLAPEDLISRKRFCMHREAFSLYSRNGMSRAEAPYWLHMRSAQPPADPAVLRGYVAQVFPKMLPSTSQPRWFCSTGLGRKELKKGELQRVLEEFKQYSKTKGLEVEEAFSERCRDFQQSSLEILLSSVLGFFRITF